MAKRKKEEAVTETAAPIQTLDTLSGETYGLAVTSPSETSANIPANEGDLLPGGMGTADASPSWDHSDLETVNVSETIPTDPATTPFAALMALGKIYQMAGDVSLAISGHLRDIAGEPELHAFMMRMQMLLGEFRHSFEQIDSGMSDTLRGAIEDAARA